MDLQALFDELAKLSPEARDEIIIALNFAAAATSPSRDDEGWSLDDLEMPHEREHRYRKYLNLAQWLANIRTAGGRRPSGIADRNYES